MTMEHRISISVPAEVTEALEALAEGWPVRVSEAHAARQAMVQGLKTLKYLPKDYRLPRPHKSRKK